MHLKPLLLIALFLTLLFLLNYYEWRYILVPTQTKPLSFHQFLSFNFLLWTIVALTKFILLSVIIYAVSLLFNIEASSGASRFKEIAGLVVLLEFVFFFQKIYKIIYFEFINPNYSNYEVMYFNPLSFSLGAEAGFVNRMLLELNLFTMVYIVAMLLGFKAIFIVPLKKASIMVLLSYLLPLMLYVAIKP